MVAPNVPQLLKDKYETPTTSNGTLMAMHDKILTFSVTQRIRHTTDGATALMEFLRHHWTVNFLIPKWENYTLLLFRFSSIHYYCCYINMLN